MGVSLCVPRAASVISAAESTFPGCREGLASGRRDTLRCQQHMGRGQCSWLSSQPSLILTPTGALGAKFCKLAPFWEALGQPGLQLGHAGMAEPQWIKAHREQTHIHQDTTQLYLGALCHGEGLSWPWAWAPRDKPWPQTGHLAGQEGPMGSSLQVFSYVLGRRQY